MRERAEPQAAQRGRGILSALFERALKRINTYLASFSGREDGLSRWIKSLAASGQVIPEPARAVMNTSKRVLIAPFNYSGQGWEWARSLRESGVASAVNLGVRVPGGFDFASDVTVSATVFLGSKKWKASQETAILDFTHLVIESFTSPLGNGRGELFRAELDRWEAEGKRIAFLCHGSDIRSPRAHRMRNKFSPFSEENVGTRRLQNRVDENRETLEGFKVPVFVSTPDLLHDVPNAKWLPLVISTGRWERAAAQRQILSGKPVVVHVPTARHLKGSEHVEIAAGKLGDLIEYHPLTAIHAQEMPNAIADADIVVDQLLIGSYGAAACEAMAASRVVVGNVDADIRARVAHISGLDLPIVQADPETLPTVMLQLVQDPDLMRARAAAGPEFVRRVHAGTKTAVAMREFLDSTNLT